MTRLLSTRPTPTHLLGAIALLLVLAAAWPWLAPIPAPPHAPAAAASPAITGIAALPALGAFAAVGERPLFSPSRRPLAAKAAISPGVATRYRLLGLVTVGAARRALVADGARRFELSEGGALDNWTVKHIEDDRVVFASPAGDTVLTLQRASPDPSPATPR